VDEAYRDKEQLSGCHLKAAATLFGAATLRALLRKGSFRRRRLGWILFKLEKLP
jgi:hypothetical protein